MLKFLDTESAPALLASIVVILAAQLLFRVIEFLWGFYKKKDELSEKSIEKLTAAMNTNTEAVKGLETRIKDVEQHISAMPKFKQDQRRLFTAVKIMAGDEWPAIRKVIMDDDVSL